MADTHQGASQVEEKRSTTPKTSFPKNKIKVLLMESISQKAVDLFVEEGFSVECQHKLTPQELKTKIRDVHVIGVRSKTKLTADVLAEAKRLLAVGCFCIGTDQTDLPVAAAGGVPVFNAPFANTRSVAEMVIAEMIMLARQLGDRNTECHSGRWNKVSKGCYEVRGKTLGIIGYGHVGSQLSILGEALGLRVIYYDIVRKLPLGLATSRPSMDALLQEADFVSLHVPRTPQTHNLIGEAEIARMKPGSFLLNAARGTVVNVDAAAAALKSGHLAGAAFDVYPTEPAAASDPFVTPLQGCPNTIMTPHIGGSTEEAQASIGIEVAHKLIGFINSGNTRDAVNFPHVNMRWDTKSHRILNIHRNVPGVLRDINAILSQYNVQAQILKTKDSVGYLMVDVDKELSRECHQAIKALPSSIKTRILF